MAVLIRHRKVSMFEDGNDCAGLPNCWDDIPVEHEVTQLQLQGAPPSEVGRPSYLLQSRGTGQVTRFAQMQITSGNETTEV